MGQASENVDCVVIGAGPAGLATARELMRAGRRVLVLEQGGAVATSWRAHRPGLRLHTLRRLSGLPGLPIPRRYGRYVTSSSLVEYLESYVDVFGIDVRFGVTVVQVKRADVSDRTSGWVVETSTGHRHRAAVVVIATGYNRRPHIPDFPGLSEFTLPYLHVADYAGGSQFAGLDVLVVGAGNAAAEAATALTASGAGRVRMAVRTTPHLVRRRVWGVPMQTIAILFGLLPISLADRLAAVISWLTIPDLSARKLTRPRADLYTRVSRDQAVPVHDTGIVGLLESGAVIPVAAVAGFTRNAVRLADGTLAEPQVVIFATGYRRGLEGLLGGLSMLDNRGHPSTRSGTAAAPGLYLVGFTVSASGALRELARDARRVARQELNRVDGARW
jgi:putative flavoprotein involved in K+ transport